MNIYEIHFKNERGANFSYFLQAEKIVTPVGSNSCEFLINDEVVKQVQDYKLIEQVEWGYFKSKFKAFSQMSVDDICTMSWRYAHGIVR